MAARRSNALAEVNRQPERQCSAMQSNRSRGPKCVQEQQARDGIQTVGWLYGHISRKVNEGSVCVVTPEAATNSSALGQLEATRGEKAFLGDRPAAAPDGTRFREAAAKASGSADAKALLRLAPLGGEAIFLRLAGLVDSGHYRAN
uniref:Uncharacterized protein n=1 Tax=Anopheles merus TaxID=30066 RepID=A0A182V6Q6_ANOME